MLLITYSFYFGKRKWKSIILSRRAAMFVGLKISYDFRNAVCRIRKPVYDSSHVKDPIHIRRTLKEEGFYFGHLGN